MSTVWTKAQQEVISLRDRNLLVSAAAGSGKTAVLVERIVQRVLDKDHPVDIDRMLIVTFTKAAAAEMRERVGDAIEKRMEEEPENLYLQKQNTLVHNAQITTIDSFCLYVVRNYFQTIGLEPTFRIADPGELQLFRGEVLADLMEAQYAAKDPGFLQLVDHYATAKSDARLIEYVEKLYDFSQSYPWPKEWLAGLSSSYELEDARQMEAQPWMQELVQYLQNIFAGLKKQMEFALILCQDADGPGMYAEAARDDVAMLEELSECTDYSQFAKRLSMVSYTKLGVNRKYTGSIEKKEQVQQIRKTMKDMVGKIQESYFYDSQEQILADLQDILPDVKALAALTCLFAEEYQKKKIEKNILDFSDIEHYALNILVDSETKQATAAAKELQGIYEEIMIDEYQDSNYVQETILRAVSREGQDRYNIFMVGDVKQSIYRFRLARPELFMEKYRSYSLDGGLQQKIVLDKNFRSRMEVIQSVNWIFSQIMQADLGKVAYDSQAELKLGASYPKPDGAGEFASELLLASNESEDESGEGSQASSKKQEKKWTDKEMEAHMAAARIQEMVSGGQKVTDKQTGQLRDAEYKDIVILLRSISGWADTFAKVLAEEGIPAHTTSQTGYFGTIEIQTILSMLSVMDNPLQDIPLASVLVSPIGNFTGEELAEIRAASKEHLYFWALEEYAQYGESEELQKKSEDFLQLLKQLRGMTVYTPIHKLIQDMLSITGYGNYLKAMPSGQQRKANVDMLLEKAIAYEQTSYKGLFHFVQYIEKLKKYQVDFGEADITSENANVVRIISIHKSKGLEFPIVFVSGLAKEFNQQDSRSRMILHPEFGIGLDWMDTEKRIRRSGFIRKILQNQIKIENLGEELRVLYVALTRAKEKLVLTGVAKKELPDSKEQRYEKEPMDFFTKYRSECYLDWIAGPIASNRILFKIKWVPVSELMARQQVGDAIQRLEYRQVKNLYKDADKGLFKEVTKRLSWSYPYAGDTELKTKISVTELKKQQMPRAVAEDEIPIEELFPEKIEVKIPAFLREEEKEEASGPLFGSTVHKIMEDLDFLRILESKDRKQELSAQLEMMVAKEHITRQMKELVKPGILMSFFSHPIAAEMAKAQKKGELYKEQPFVMGIAANEVYEHASEELVLIQGIVDACWMDEGGITILDYKTDRVKKEEELVKRYELQLQLYAKALERAMGKPVKKTLLYSFHLQETVEVECKDTAKSSQ